MSKVKRLYFLRRFKFHIIPDWGMVDILHYSIFSIDKSWLKYQWSTRTMVFLISGRGDGTYLLSCAFDNEIFSVKLASHDSWSFRLRLIQIILSRGTFHRTSLAFIIWPSSLKIPLNVGAHFLLSLHFAPDGINLLASLVMLFLVMWSWSHFRSLEDIRCPNFLEVSTFVIS